MPLHALLAAAMVGSVDSSSSSEIESPATWGAPRPALYTADPGVRTTLPPPGALGRRGPPEQVEQVAHQKHTDQESSPWHYRAQTKTGSCFQAKGKGCVAGQCNDVNVIARRDSDSQLTILSGSISGAPVQANQVIAISDIGGDHSHGYNPGGGQRAVKCNNNKSGLPPEDCRCLNITAFGIDSLDHPTSMVAYASDECVLFHPGGWTTSVPLTTIACPST